MNLSAAYYFDVHYNVSALFLHKKRCFFRQ